MEIYRISCIVLFILMIISFLLLAIFPFIRHKDNFYLKMLNNLNIGFFSGLMVSFCTTYVGYFYAKEDFFNSLLRQSSYIYMNLQNMQKNLSSNRYPPNESQKFLPVILTHLETYTNSIERDAKDVNFLSYSPFIKDDDSYKDVEALKDLFNRFKEYPDFFIHMKFLDNERNNAIREKDKEALASTNKEIESFILEMKSCVSKDLNFLDNFMNSLENEYTYQVTPWTSLKKPL